MFGLESVLGGGGVIGDLMGGAENQLAQVPFVGGFFESQAEKDAKEQFDLTAQRYRQLMPELEQSRMNALGQQMRAFVPTNNMLGAMAGGDPAMMMDLGAFANSPMTPGMTASPPGASQNNNPSAFWDIGAGMSGTSGGPLGGFTGFFGV